MADLEIGPQAAALHESALVWDMTLPFVDLCGSDAKHLQTLRRMAACGYSLVSLTVSGDSRSLETSVRRIGEVLALLRDNADFVVQCGSVQDIREAKAGGLLGVIFNFQGSQPFDRNVDLIECYYQLGVRHALMAYNERNDAGDGCHERTDGGLSRLGVQYIAEMNRVGMLVDCTHTGYRTTMDIMDVSSAPVIFSHSNVRAIVDHERNIRDDQIKACAAMDGVIGVTGVGLFIADNDSATENILKQIDYIAELVGPRHIGLGMDYVSDVPFFMGIVAANRARYPDPSYEVPAIAFAEPEQTPQITEGLLARGYSETEIRGILGENFARVADQVWK